MANTKAEIIDAAVDAGLFPDAESAAGYTKPELIALWFGG
jgi:hypothetical protein